MICQIYGNSNNMEVLDSFLILPMDKCIYSLFNRTILLSQIANKAHWNMDTANEDQVKKDFYSNTAHCRLAKMTSRLSRDPATLKAAWM